MILMYLSWVGVIIDFPCSRAESANQIISWCFILVFDNDQRAVDGLGFQ